MLDRAALHVLNHLLQDARWARSRLAPFAGKTLRLTLPPLKLDLVVSAEGLFEPSELENFDVEISFPADAPMLALAGTESLYKEANISGSAEFADALGFVMRNLRWDFEEDLSRYVGDIAAHRVAGLFTAFDAWQRQARQNLAENLAEYLTEEQPTLAKAEAVKTFSKEIDGLRDDLQQLEQRVSLLGG
ncbi:MAG: ubiquinone biosynthesis protein [Sterolibacterium sp.]